MKYAVVQFFKNIAYTKEDSRGHTITLSEEEIKHHPEVVGILRTPDDIDNAEEGEGMWYAITRDLSSSQLGYDFDDS